MGDAPDLRHAALVDLSFEAEAVDDIPRLDRFGHGLGQCHYPVQRTVQRRSGSEPVASDAATPLQ
jgi:hypothetical protein